MQEFRGVAKEAPSESNRPVNSTIHAKGGQDRNYMAAAREKLLPLISEVNKRHVDDYISLLFQSATPDEFVQGMSKQGGHGAGYNQLLGPFMIKLYKQEEGLRQAIHTKVRELGVSDKTIESYFTKHIVNGLLGVTHMVLFEDASGLASSNKSQEFVTLTDYLMLDVLKRHIGLETGPE